MSVNPVLKLLKQRAAAAAAAEAPAAAAEAPAAAAPAAAAAPLAANKANEYINENASAAAARAPRLITETSFTRGILSGEKAIAYSRAHGLPSPFVNRGPGPYVIVGHGFEELVPFDERPVVPPGITLVTNVLSGVPSTMPQTCGMINMLSREENRGMVTNPVEARFNMKRMLVDDEIEHLHVYTEGQKMPKLFVNLLGNFTKIIKKDVGRSQKQVWYETIFRSGVYEFPLQPYEGEDEIHISERLTNLTNNNVRTKNTGYTLGHERKCLQFEKRFPRYSNLTLDDVGQIYKESLHPTPEYLTSIIDQIHTKTISIDQLGILLGDIPITDIFNMLGPGVYYFIVCRANKKENIDVKFQNLSGDLFQITRPDALVVNDSYVDPKTFYDEFRISPYDVDFVKELLELIAIVRMSPMDMENKKLIIRKSLDELPESVNRALSDIKYFPDQFTQMFKEFVDETSAPKQLIRTASLKQQMRNARRSRRQRKSLRRAATRRNRK